jgi:hypothetical protein
VGVYGGAQAHRQGVTARFLNKVLSSISVSSITDGLVAVLCVQGENTLGADYLVGVAFSTTTDGLSVVHDTLRHWSNGTCLTSDSAHQAWDSSLRVPAPVGQNGTNTSSHNGKNRRSAVKRAECRYIRVVAGDGCDTLASKSSKCGISGADFTTYNPGSTICSTLREGQAVCCDSGFPPDLRPRPDAGFNCAAYTSQSGDYCAKLAATYQITVEEIEEYNRMTWDGMVAKCYGPT